MELYGPKGKPVKYSRLIQDL